MDERLINLIIGSLLHDVGKIIHRTGEMKSHSKSGWDFLKDIPSFEGNTDICECVKYHHARELAKANLQDNSLAFITYIADNISAASDRREDYIEGEEEQSNSPFDKSAPLSSVFNVLNGHNKKYFYAFQIDSKLNYPTENKVPYTMGDYAQLKTKLKEQLSGINISKEYINSILHLLEITTSFVPSSTNTKELTDISLFDHSKTTAAIASCLYYYLHSLNYKETLFTDEKSFRQEEAFLLFSYDISGIQDFIYTVSGSNALKALRARSLYLELLLENIVDELLTHLNLSRCNLLYTGGGHAYLLLPNTEKAKGIIKDFNKKLKTWFLAEFDVSLYIAHGYTPCSSDELANDIGSVYEKVGKEVSISKSKRYNHNEILALNFTNNSKEERECVECKKNGVVNSRGCCNICEAFISISPLLMRKDIFFIVTENNKDITKALPLPFSKSIIVGDADLARQKNNIRIYSKNNPSMGLGFSTNIWMGDYSAKHKTEERVKTFEELANDAKGIDRISVLRADVDNLGKAFISGFKEQKNGEIVENSNRKYETISRSSTLSRQLSLFFKYHLNGLLEKKDRNALVVYSGGDDLFIVGGWDDTIDIAKDLQEAFSKYTQNTLTISAGIGIYNHSYPISRIAYEVSELENAAKTKDIKKNKVTLFNKGIKGEDKAPSDWVLDWQQLPFLHDVYTTENQNLNSIQEKLFSIKQTFGKDDESGKSFLYKILNLLRDSEDSINLARYAYLLGRAKEKRRSLDVQQFYKWIKDNHERKELEIAITLYSYETR
ncbi:MAG TPA: type III-A CRISPR-associated protein Cas10/Csm1 [Oscillospiraceae bacterium]|nr:type III-A CRISPR-associated protein Cas10/Csm1 [Oscillospiraceae bacterium]